MTTVPLTVTAATSRGRREPCSQTWGSDSRLCEPVRAASNHCHQTAGPRSEPDPGGALCLCHHPGPHRARMCTCSKRVPLPRVIQTGLATPKPSPRLAHLPWAPCSSSTRLAVCGPHTVRSRSCTQLGCHPTLLPAASARVAFVRKPPHQSPLGQIKDPPSPAL